MTLQSPEWIMAEWRVPANIAAGTSTRAASSDAVPAGARFLTQVHAATVLDASDVAFAHGAPEADGIYASQPGSCLVIKTADCLPVLISSAAGDEIAALHCGWRSLAADILANALAHFSSAPEQLRAWFGPAISQAAFEVQDDVRDVFLRADPGAAACFLPNPRGRYQADLYGLARRRLAALGVSEVYGGGLCTFGDPDRFYSYRRDQGSARLLSMIHLK